MRKDFIVYPMWRVRVCALLQKNMDISRIWNLQFAGGALSMSAGAEAVLLHLFWGVEEILQTVF